MSNKPSAGLSPTMLSNSFKALGPDDPALKSIEVGFTRLYSTMTSIYKAREKNAANPLKTELANAKATADYTGKVSVPALNTAQQSNDNAKAIIKGLQAEINAPLARNGAHAAETRSLLRELKHTERKDFLTNAVKGNDIEALAAVFAAPAYLSGIDQMAADHFRAQYHRNNNAQVLDRIEHIKGAVQLLNNAGQIFSGECGKIIHPKGLERARKLEQAAQEASNA
ncbi:MAG: hypothetical protein DRI46_13705 [Chloroflexi bacterium]|nr:MAG: hypothetical protein DRI46_13705 [Chloroflexota bacterium]